MHIITVRNKEDIYRLLAAADKFNRAAIAVGSKVFVYPRRKTSSAQVSA